MTLLGRTCLSGELDALFKIDFGFISQVLAGLAEQMSISERHHVQRTIYTLSILYHCVAVTYRIANRLNSVVVPVAAHHASDKVAMNSAIQRGTFVTFFGSSDSGFAPRARHTIREKSHCGIGFPLVMKNTCPATGWGNCTSSDAGGSLSAARRWASAMLPT